MSNNKFKEFPISSWAIDNRITILILTFFIMVGGLLTFQSLPKENFPEIAFPVIYVSTPYPGTSAEDIENLVTRKIEKELNGIEGIKEINSTSVQDFSSIFVEFDTDVDLEEAKQDVKDAVDKSKGELPTDLPNDPQVIDINLSEIPIIFLQLTGPFDNVTLKRYAEEVKDELEKRKEILRVDIVGAPEREIQIDVDLYRMEAASVTLGNIEQAVAGENVIISGGELDVNSSKVAVRVVGEFNSVDEIGNLVVRSSRGNIVYLRDVANIVDGFADNDSYARLNGNPVMTLNVIKKAGENLVDAVDNIKLSMSELQEKRFPANLDIIYSADQSIRTRGTLNELINTIIIGFILVTLVLMFFMGVRDSLFVGLAVPLSSAIAFLTLPALGFTMNMIVLFSFILAMGIVVDNAIVVIENTYRIFNEENLSINKAAKKAAGEVIAPVFSGTLTTVCPFLPLLFWPGTVGEFMGFLPVVLIITLFASLFVAYVINPVFAVTFMKREEEGTDFNYRKTWIGAGMITSLGVLSHLASAHGFGNFMIFIGLFLIFNAYVLRHAISWFQNKALVSIKNTYRKTLAFSVDHPWVVWLGTTATIILTVVLIGASNMKFIQFPQSDPNFIYVYTELPTGTDIAVTDSITRILEKRVVEVIGEENPAVNSMITNVAIGAGDANSFDSNTSKPNKSKITVEFVEMKERGGVSTRELLDAVRDKMGNVAGAKITVEQEASGPPTSAPIEILVTSEDFGDLMNVSEDMLIYLDSLNIPGIEKFKWDVDYKRPELLVNINRQKASELGLSSGQIGQAIRTALFGKDISKFRDNEDEYDIMLRLDESYRSDISSLLNMNIGFMDQATGGFKSVPISAVANFEYSSSYGGVNRTDLEKSVKITSNILSDANVNDISAEVEYWVNQFADQGRIEKSVNVEVGGQSKDQAEEGAFLGKAFGIAFLLIFLILVTQFNSLSNVLILMTQVFLSIIGVFLAHALLGMEFSVVLSGMGIVVLAGIVVNNGIILLDYINVLRKKGYDLREAVIEGGATRFSPVILTASSTVLGLVPLAFSINVNFGTLLSDLDPQLFIGGDSAAFWEPFSWSIIFGLSFATIVTLVFVPVLYFVVKRAEARFGLDMVKRDVEEQALDAAEEPMPEHVSMNGHSETTEETDPEEVAIK
ncbi:efflux RND transporter permease subunit [Pontibacter sp. G13]|uniref:efflux RND transporter permease subunit n=1 Tax=Pontibacter sp. G13 TaxID=3074898 RepID=UPI00288960AF|nr:efflux RND transporter permease subunit [Pontibacter sp. G13]WNJ19181.1 efflux RND transporter permease subunit [Pontibacter sp. G13]